MLSPDALFVVHCSWNAKRHGEPALKVLNVNHLLDPVTGGGTAERTFQLSRFQSRAGLRCTVLTLDIGLANERLTELDGVRVVAVPCLNQRFFVPRLPAEVLERLVADADVVHLMGHWTVLNAMVFHACRKLGKPYVICPAGALKPFGRSLWLKRLYDVAVGRKILDSAGAWVAITENERADFSPYGVPIASVDVIPNGIDPARYNREDASAEALAFRERFGLGTVPFMLFLGRLNEIKGPDLLLEAFIKVASRFPDMHLVFAGPDGGMQRSLQETAERAAPGCRVRFVGYVDGADKIAALRTATLLAIPSRREAMSIVVLEAGICGTPVLFTDNCGLDDVSREDAGVMVGAGADSIAAGLAAMLQDESSRLRRSGRLRALVQERFLWSIQAERYKALFARLAGSKG